MNKVYISGAAFLLATSFAYAQVAEQTSDTALTKEAQSILGKDNPALNGDLKALLQEREAKVKALRLEYEAKVKAIREDYQVRLKSLVGQNASTTKARIEALRDKKPLPPRGTSTAPVGTTTKPRIINEEKRDLRPAAVRGQVQGVSENAVGIRVQNFLKGFFGGAGN